MSVQRFARDLAIQQIGYWRKAKRAGLRSAAAFARRRALYYFAASKGRTK